MGFAPTWLRRESPPCFTNNFNHWICIFSPPPSPENIIPSHANCMQHVLRCWERQSDGSEYKKTFRRPGLRPDPAEGAYTALPKLPSWWGGAVHSPRTLSPALGLSGLASPTPTPKLVPTPLHRPTPGRFSSLEDVSK